MQIKSKIIGVVTLAFFLYAPFVSKANTLMALPIAASQKRIDVNLVEQRLRYYVGNTEVGNILISSGIKWLPTPSGMFYIQKKVPVINYRGRNLDGTMYNFPNTKWNLMFLPRYYIHGAYWHNEFGHVKSHGCVNVSYRDMPELYDFADVGTPVYVHY